METLPWWVTLNTILLLNFVNSFASFISKEYEKLRFSQLSKIHRAIEYARDKSTRSKIDTANLEGNILSIQIPESLRNLGKKLVRCIFN